MLAQVLAGGRISGVYDPKSLSQFNYETFGYNLVSLAAGETQPQGRRDANLTIDNSIPISSPRCATPTWAT